MNEIEIKRKDGWMIISRSSEQQTSRWIKTVEKKIENEKTFRENISDETTENKQKILL